MRRRVRRFMNSTRTLWAIAKTGALWMRISVLDDASNASALTVSVPVSSNSHVSVLPGDPPAASAGFKDALLSLGSRKRKHVLH